MNQYAPMPGVPLLLKMISSKNKKLYGRYYSPEDEIVITSGATQALFTAISTIVNKGDEVIIFEPAYDSYAPAVILNGGIPVFIKPERDFRINWEEFGNRISDKVKLVIINSPHNPAGIVLTREDIQVLESFAAKFPFLIISDEVYEHIVFDGKSHLSISGSKILSERSFVISSFGKTFHTTGWKVGYCLAPKNMMDEFKRIHQFTVFAVNTPVQYAYADYLENEDHYLLLNSFYQAKRDLLAEEICDSRFRYTISEGTYFQLLDYSGISSLNDVEFCEYLVKEKGIAAIPLSPFYSRDYDGKYIRVCFAKKDEVIKKGGEILRNI
jgi:methionine transaminase